MDKTRVNIEMNRQQENKSQTFRFVIVSLSHLNVFCFSHSLALYLILNLFHMSSCYFWFLFSVFLFSCISNTSTFNGSVFLLSSWAFFLFVCVSIISSYSHCKTDSLFFYINHRYEILSLIYSHPFDYLFGFFSLFIFSFRLSSLFICLAVFYSIISVWFFSIYFFFVSL